MNASWRKGLLGRGNSKCKNQEVFAFRGRSQWGWSPGTEKEEDVRKEGVGMWGVRAWSVSKAMVMILVLMNEKYWRALNKSDMTWIWVKESQILLYAA